MECIYCGRISRARERPDGRCPECGHRFALDPGARPRGGSDAEFKAAIDRVSDGRRLRFTVRQLWLAVNGRTTLPPPPRPASDFAWSNILFLTLPTVVIVLISGMWGLLVMAVLGVVIGTAFSEAVAKDEEIRYRDRLRPRLPFEVFMRDQLTPWLQVHGDVPGLLPPRDADAAAAPGQVPADAFAVNRVVVTDQWETAQVLVANGFHLEHSCAVLSRDGYPDGTAGTVRDALRRNPRLTVFALHDASPAGCMLPVELRGPEWFPDPSVRIVDLGMRPETVRRLQLPPLPDQRLPALPQPLYELLVYPDREWLAGGYVYELAAVPPAELMRAAYEGMAAAGPNDGSGGTPAYDDAGWAGVGAGFRALAGDDGGDGAHTAAVGVRMSDY